MNAHHLAVSRPMALAALLCVALCCPSPGGELGADASAAFRNGLACFAGGKLDDALTWYGHAIAGDPNMAVAWLGRSVAGMEKGWQELSTQPKPNPEMKRAIENDAIEAQRLDPRVFDAFRQAAGPQFAKAIDEFANRIDVLASIHSTVGETRMMENKIPDALAECDRAVGLMPRKAIFRFMRGSFCRDFGQFDKAISDFDELDCQYRAAPGDKTCVAFYELSLPERGRAYLGKGDPDRAMQDLDEAIRLHPERPEPYLYRAQAYARKGDLARAKADRHRATQLQRTRKP